MIIAKFCGWFHSRLATDPDPSDEKRGISGMIKVYPGEPDLDRLIRFQAPPFDLRSYAPKVGVTITRVFVDSKEMSNHPLTGGAVNLLGSPMFKGENGIVAEDGLEPIVPFIFEIKTPKIHLIRTVEDSPAFVMHPYKKLQAGAIVDNYGAMAESTKIYDARNYFLQRAQQIEHDIKAEKDELKKEIGARRVKFLKSRGATQFFSAYMAWSIPLEGKGEVTIKEPSLKETITLKHRWSVNLQLGGWDPDVMCGFAEGYLVIST